MKIQEKQITGDFRDKERKKPDCLESICHVQAQGIGSSG